MLANNTKYDQATKTAGKLQGDSTAVSLQRQIRTALMGDSPASSVFASLASVGVEMQKNGTLTVNDSKLTTAITGNLQEVRKLFATTDLANPRAEGIAVRLRRLGDSLLGTEGPISTRTEGLNSTLSLNKKRQDEITQRLALTEARLRKQYQSLDTNMAGINGLNTYVSQQVAAWNKSSS
jgi:flagellar hook-associated protein 2